MAAQPPSSRLLALPHNLQRRIFSFLVPSTLIATWTPREPPKIERGGRKSAWKDYQTLLRLNRTTHRLARAFFDETVTISFMVMPSLVPPPLPFPGHREGIAYIMPERVVAGLRAIEVCRIFDFTTENVWTVAQRANVLVTARIARDGQGNPSPLALTMQGMPAPVGMMFEWVIQRDFVDGKFGFRERVRDVVDEIPWYGGPPMSVAEMAMMMAWCFVEAVQGGQIF